MQQRELFQDGLVEQFLTFKGLVPVLKALTSTGLEARFVGGCVRNALLREPIGDIDLATQLFPLEVMEHLKNAGIKAIPTGLAHGTITAVHSGNAFEITTLRSDVDCDGRHAKVTFSPYWSQDAGRRDFTMNAISCSIDGTIYDYYGGMEDLQNGVVRFVGEAEQRVKEDYLRILRYFRFHAHYGVESFHEDSLKACLKHAKGLRELSGERIQQEMIKLLSAADPSAVLDIMRDGNIDPYIGLPLLNPITLSLLIEHETTPKPWLRLAWLLRKHDIKKEHILALKGRWKLSNKHTEYLQAFMGCHLPQKALTDAGEKRILIYRLGKNYWHDLICLEWAEHTLKTGEDGSDIFKPLMAFGENWNPPPFPITGDDVMKALNMKPGKEIGAILTSAENWWLREDCAPSKEEVLAYVRSSL